ncbi:hypothetical protein [Desulfitobacterium metallireducens]|uniref:Uncharacterized protein n=1 Tax=Desulfitobacterium metallireducens DSM 15288 TaxID=871968 RepID=W0EE87_9FIRM|nr:hypothetical protein [Desulfitobacterium metallireducens]AHF07386.1 hypothetical protein DESME_10345 [Desulfitobacterium metallireducens DSM 15288]
MGKKVRMLGLFLICIITLAGCSNQNFELIKENTQLKTEMESLQQQVESTNNKVNQLEELYELRNILDDHLHKTLSALIKGDYEVAQKNMDSNIRIENKKVITKAGVGRFEFIIPDKSMRLRQRTFMKDDKDNYTSIYEIYDAGYLSGNKYDDRTYTLNVTYSQVNGEWKMSSLKIDE